MSTLVILAASSVFGISRGKQTHKHANTAENLPTRLLSVWVILKLEGMAVYRVGDWNLVHSTILSPVHTSNNVEATGNNVEATFDFVASFLCDFVVSTKPKQFEHVQCFSTLSKESFNL